MTLKAGTRVRFNTNQLGTLNSYSNRFTEHIVGDGDEGEVISELPDGWLAVRPDTFQDEYVPVHPEMVDQVSA